MIEEEEEDEVKNEEEDGETNIYSYFKMTLFSTWIKQTTGDEWITKKT